MQPTFRVRPPVGCAREALPVGRERADMALKVPAVYEDGIRALGDLAANEADELTAALGRAPSFASFDELVGHVRTALPALGQDEAGSVVNALFGLRTMLRLREGDVLEFANDVSAALFPQDPEKREQLSNLLISLVMCAAVASSASAAELTLLAERNYRSARILSDIRPVFSDDLDEAPGGAVVLHRLSLSYWNDRGERETIEVVLDYGDLVNLEGVVTRAQKKAKTLHITLQQSGLKQFQLEDGD